MSKLTKVDNKEKPLDSLESSISRTPQSRKAGRNLLKKKSLKVKVEREHTVNDGSFDIAKSAKAYLGLKSARYSTLIRGLSTDKKDKADKFNLVVPSPSDGSGKTVMGKRAEHPRRFTFIANRKKSLATGIIKKAVDNVLNVPVNCETEGSITVSQELRKQYDLFLKKQISLVQSKKRVRSQNEIFRNFQSLIQYL